MNFSFHCLLTHVIKLAAMKKTIYIYFFFLLFFFLDSRNDMQKEGYLKELLKELPDAHYSLLKYLCQFLIKVAEHHVENRMNLGNLATVFGPNCFQ